MNQKGKKKNVRSNRAKLIDVPLENEPAHLKSVT